MRLIWCNPWTWSGSMGKPSRYGSNPLNMAVEKRDIYQVWQMDGGEWVKSMFDRNETGMICIFDMDAIFPWFIASITAEFQIFLVKIYRKMFHWYLLHQRQQNFCWILLVYYIKMFWYVNTLITQQMWLFVADYILTCLVWNSSISINFSLSINRFLVDNK